MTADTLDQLLDALARHRTGDIAGAGAQCRAVLTREQHPAALHLLGVIAMTANQPFEALALLRRAADLRPADSDTRLALGNALAATGETVAAVAAYRRVLSDQPGHPAALANLSQALRSLGETQAALEATHAAVAALPGSAKALTALALALLQARQADHAEAAADAAIAVDPKFAEAWIARGTARSALRRSAAAIADLDHALTLDPGNAGAHLNLGNAHLDCDNDELAERHIRHALTLDPSLAEAHASLGFLLTTRNLLPAAIEACDAAIRLRPRFAQAHWNRSFAHLLAGNFVRGWADYEWRKQSFPDDFSPLPSEEWRGDPLAGRHLLVRAEQGMGDTIQFARFLPLLVAAGATVTLACAAPLIPLLRQLPVTVVAREDVPPPHDVWVDQMSLPRLFGTTPDTIPTPDRYLSAQDRPAQDRPNADGGGVGIVWAGNPTHINDRRRSLPGSALAALAAVPGVAWVSLQTGPRGAEANGVFGIADNAADLTDFAATAAMIAGLDLVIACDTAVAHLAAAMGKPVWIMLPHAPDWRWMHSRDDSPWYGSARLFRQPVAGDWASVTAAAAGALIEWRATSGQRAA